MSAFIVSTKTMNLVVNAICTQRARVFASLPVATHADRTALGEALFKMNADAVDARYGDHNVPPPYVFEPIGATLNKYQALSCVRCLIYQCSEGRVPETKLYKRLDKISGELALEIVSELPAYRQAEWDPAD